MATNLAKSTPVVPHPVLHDYYDHESERRAFVRDLFDRTAQYYDGIVGVSFLGSGSFGRRRALRMGGLTAGMKMLDIAVGTGLLSRQAVELVGPEGEVIGIDMSLGMLQAARRNVSIPLLRGMGERLPFPDDTFDFVTIGYALRHFEELESTFRECRRVLRDNGTLLVLEITKPEGPIGQALLRAYLGRIVPTLCRLAKGRRDSEELMRYHWETMEKCVPPAHIAEAMKAAEFEVNCWTELGIFRAYCGKNRPG